MTAPLHALTIDGVHRLVQGYLAGNFDAAALCTLFGAVRPAPDDPIAPVVAMVLHILRDATPESTRHKRLAALVEQRQS